MKGNILIKAIQDCQFLLASAAVKDVYEDGQRTEDKQIQLILFVVDVDELNGQEVRVKVDYTSKNLEFVKSNLGNVITLDNFIKIEESEAFDFSTRNGYVSYIGFTAKNISEAVIEV